LSGRNHGLPIKIARFWGEARLRTKRQLKAQSALIMSFVRCKKNKAYVSVKIGII
jgi:hypothetical protein